MSLLLVMSSNGNSSDSFARRDLLKSAGALGAGLGTGAVANPAAAETTVQDAPEPDVDDTSTEWWREPAMEAEYSDPAAAEGTVEETAGPVLAELSAEGYLEDDTAASIQLDGLVTEDATDLSDGYDARVVTYEGEERKRLATNVDGPRDTVYLDVEPETGKAYAAVPAHDQDADFEVIEQTADGDTVRHSTDATCTDNYCTNTCNCVYLIVTTGCDGSYFYEIDLGYGNPRCSKGLAGHSCTEPCENCCEGCNPWTC